MLSIEDRFALMIKQEHREGFFLGAGATLDLSLCKDNNCTFSYSTAIDPGMDNPDLSQFHNYLSFLYFKDVSERQSLTLTLQLHDLMEDFVNPLNRFIDGIILCDYFFDKNEYFSFYATGKTGYYIGTEEETYYLTGPLVSLETGLYWYPAADLSYLRFSIGGGYYHFRRDMIYGCNEEGGSDKLCFLDTSNKYGRFTAQAEGRYQYHDLSLLLLVQYSYAAWLGDDIYNAYSGGSRIFDWKERRIDHTLQSSADLTYTIQKKYKIALQYLFKRNFSNEGDNPYDPLDYNYPQHRVQLAITYIF